ncbi:MAG: RHS repeat domain-containing protein, partial [Phycisphaerales bacterium]
MIRHKRSRYAYSTCILAAYALMISLPQRAEAVDPILEVYDASLTTYLYDVGDGSTLAQHVRPLMEQRGVNLDGSLRLGSTHPMSLQGNPFGEAWNANMMLSGVRLDTGTYVINDVDLALPSPGPSWVIGRSYNSRQEDEAGTHLDSNGYQGFNWFQSAQPEIVLFEHATDDDKDVIYLVYGADRYIEFKRFDATSTEYKSKNGAAGVIEFTKAIDGDPDLYVYTDQRGWEFWFFGFDTLAFNAKGQLWKIVAPKPGAEDYVSFVNSKTSASTAVSLYDSDGIPNDAYDSAVRRYKYTNTNGRLTKVEVRLSGTLVAQVDYEYYGASDNHGSLGDLKLVTISTPLTEDTSGYDPVKWLIRKKYYRYWKGTWTSNNPGHDHLIKYIYDFEGTRNFDWGENGTEIPPDLDDGFLAASDTSLKAYASAYFEYEENSYKIANTWFNGECGCSGAANGTHKFTYEDSGYTNNPGYDTAWKNRTIVERPEATYKTADPDVTSFVTQYFDEVGQPLHRVNTKLTPSNTSGSQKVWATNVVRNSDGTNKLYGQITAIHSPANVTAYAHSTGILTTSPGAGLVTVFTRGTTGVLRGFLQDAKHKTGTNAENVYLDLTLAYIARTLDTGDSDVDRPVISSQRIYTKEITSGTTDSRLTSFAQTWHEISDATDVLYITPEILTTTFPVVSTGSNGPGGTALESKLYLNEAGQTVWQKTTDAIINYWQYKDDDGRLEKSIQDADTDHTDFTDPNITIPSGFESSGTELHLVTCFGYVGGTGMGMSDGGCTSGAGGDSVVTGDGPATVTYRARLDDGRMARLVFPHFEDKATDEYYGPVSYTVFNLAGQVELQGVIALSANSGEYTTVAPTNFIDETKADPLEAIDHGGTTIGTVEQMSTSIFNETGLVLQQSRAYYIVPDGPTFGEGTEGTDYDATRYAYDALGRSARIKDPTGTIQRTVYDTRGRTTEQWTGTNDYAFDSGETTGPDDMVKTAALEYDSGSDEGNSYLTKQTLFVESTATNKRESTFEHDVRGRVLLQVNPEEPKHVLSVFDNLGRLTASGLYSTGDGTDDVEAGDDPVTRSDDRLSLSQTSYDELGRVFRNKTHKIDMADGSDDDNLLTDNWFDKRGRLIKVDGSQLMKYLYNRLGQQTHQFILAVDDDTAYAHALDVSGDIVLQESQTVLEVNTGITLMSAVIDRDHDDFGGGEHTGALDDNSDGGTPDPLKYTAADIHGQIQIAAYWYDSINRLTDTVSYGTNDGSDFTRPSTPPASSDTELRTTYAFNADGTLLSITDPEDLETQYEYDDLGRQTAVIDNYVNGVPSGLTADDDHVTRYVYDDGLRIKLWVDIYPVDFGDSTPDAEDQVTTYTYGVSPDDSPGASKFDSHLLLREIKYPDSGGATDVVLFAYNAQGQQIWSRDQELNIFQTDYDDVGREEHRRVTTLDAAFDNRILRITTVYDDLGRIETVSQYDNATVGSGTIQDEVKYTYDGWGNLTNFEQDNNSAVGAGGSIDDYEVKYNYAKKTGGRNTIRRTTLWQLHASIIKKTLTYEYSSANGLHDNDVSRVTKVKVGNGPGATIVAMYDYLGVGQIVGTDFPEPDVFSNLYTSGSSYDHMDRFNRVTTNLWTKDLATDIDFYNVDITYDRDSSITLIEDNVHVGFDVDYTIDNLNRLQKAEEGTWNGSIITPRTRQQLWEDPSANPALDQLGNWTHVRLDLDGNNDFVGTNEYDDDRTHNIVNELTARDVDNDTTDDYTLVYDKLGELTDDKEFYEYKYDAFGRLIEVAGTTTQALVVEYTYNGL